MAERNALMPGRGVARESNALVPDTQADGSPNPDATAGWQQAYDWRQAQRAQSVAEGYLDPVTGLPTAKGLQGAGNEYWNALLMGSTAPGVRAFHGSPHSFERFDLGKIGTGEGAQAYGHGLYFAEKEGTAKYYRDALSNGPNQAIADAQAAYRAAQGKMDGLHSKMVQETLDGGLAQPDPEWGTLTVSPHPDVVAKYSSQWDAAANEATAAKAAYDKVAGTRNPGHMYEVNIGSDPEHFLHWDKPLSEQSKQVQQAIQSLHPGLPDGVQQLPNGRWAVKSGDNIVGREDGWPTQGDANYVQKMLVQDAVKPSSTGQELYKRFSKAGDPAAAAQTLQDAGIPGIRYLDGGSRGAGEGSHNLVVFNPENIEIIRKYGLAGLGLGGAAAATAAQQGGGTDTQ